MANNFEICEILLVEDNPGDIYMFEHTLKNMDLFYSDMKKDNNFKCNIVKIMNGDDVIPYLQREGNIKPDIIILDLNLPGKSGLDILKEIKMDESLRIIPVIVLSSSRAEHDVQLCYKHGANCFISKPHSLDQYADFIRTVRKFWHSVVTLPPKKEVFN